MATYSSHLHLKKPDGTEDAIITDINNNMDLIDGFAGDTLKVVGKNKEWVANSDADDFIDTGTYYFSTGNSNLPLGYDYGELIVLSAQCSTTILVLQIYSCSARLWYREYRSSAWSTWTEIANKYTIHSTTATIPVSTAAGSYKIGTFSSLGIPAGSTILSAQCSNVTSSVCHVSGFSVVGDDVYVYLVEPVAVANGVVTVVYKYW